MWTSNSKILVVVAHPDDEVLGCGGTIARLAQSNEVAVLILGSGGTSRADGQKALNKYIHQLKKQAEQANKILGVSDLYFRDFPDNQFDTVSLLEITQEVEQIKNLMKPTTVITHHHSDINIDHQITHKAVLTAFRAKPNELCTQILTCYVPSATEWNNYTTRSAFIGNYFVDITTTLELKIDALSCYQSELCKFPHPRSVEHLKNLAYVTGANVGCQAAEAFQLIRCIV